MSRRALHRLALLLALLGSATRTHAQPTGTEDAPAPDVTEAPAQDDADAPAPAPSEPPPSDDATASDADTDEPTEDEAAVRRRGAIEDESLEEMLGLGLEETMGSTDAASRTVEDVLSAPASVSSLDETAIRLSGARTIPELLRLVTGVQVQRVAPGSYLVAMRGAGGITGNNVIVMLDGVPLNSPVDGSIDWSTVPIHPRDLERIDVVRGPVSSIYGANAYTGVIQLVSYRGFGSVAQGAARAEAGIDLEGRPVGTLSGRYTHAGHRFQRAVFGSATYDGVFRDSNDGALEPRIGGSLLARLGGTLDAGQLDFEAAVSAASGSSLEHFVFESIAERRVLGLAQLRFTSRDLPGALGTVTAFARTQIRAVDTERAAYAGFSYAGTRSARSSVGAELSLAPHRTLTATVGGQFDLDRVTAPYLHPDENGAYQPGWGFYARAAWDPTDRWSITASVRGDVPTMTGRTSFSYRGSVVYHTDDLAIRLVGASAFRAPTYVEVGGRFVDPGSNLILLEGSPSLRNPANDGGELAFTFSPRVGVRIGASAWFARMRNLVIEDFEPIVRRTFLNDDHGRWMMGGDLEAEYAHSDAFRLAGFASLTQFLTEDEEDIPTIGREESNATLLVGLSARGSVRNDRMRYGVAAAFANGRSFLMYAGIPTSLLDASIDPSVQLTATLEHELGESFPLWLSLRVQSNLPKQAESPLPGASVAGTSFLLALEHRRD